MKKVNNLLINIIYFTMKEKFIKSTIILIIGGMFTKLLGIVIRMTMSRVVSIDTVGLYMMILPTFSLMMAISQLGFAKSISKLVSENRYKNKNLLFSILPVSLLINISLTIFLVFASKFIANNLLHNSDAYLPILAISLVLPFDSLSSILRGFFFGKEKMFPHIVSNLAEQIVRLLLMILVIPLLNSYGIVITTVGLILINVISELCSSLVLIFFLPKRFTIKKCDLRPNKGYIKDVLNISIPTTTTRIIGTIGYFFEPIILTSVLMSVGYSNSFITREYGIITAFVMPILLLPGFFTNAISNAMLPIISREYTKNNISYIKRKLRTSLSISLLISIVCILIINLIPQWFLSFFYNTTEGVNYLRFLSPIFILYSLESPLSSFLEATNHAKLVMYDNIIGIIIKTIVMFILSYFKIGLYGLLIGMVINILIVSIKHFMHVRKIINT